MKKMFLLLLVLLLITPSIYAHVIPANDSRITYVGRTLQEGNDVSFDWTGVYFRIAFSGERLAIKVSDTHRNYYNVWIDAPMSDEPHSFGAVMLALVEAYRNGITEIEKTKYRYAETVNAIK